MQVVDQIRKGLYITPLLHSEFCLLPPSRFLVSFFVSLQLEQLTQLVQKLTARIASEEDSRELLRAQLDEAYAASPAETKVFTLLTLQSFGAA